MVKTLKLSPFGGILLIGLSHATVLYHVDFEDGTYGAGRVETTGGADPGGRFSVKANPAPDVRNPSARSGYATMAPGYVRAEFSSPRFPTAGKTRVYQWSLYIPNDFFTGATFDDLLFTQWKTFPCSKSNFGNQICYEGGIFNDIHNSMSNGPDMFMRWRANPDCQTYQLNVVQGRWWNLQEEIKWSTGNDGYFKFWIDGTLVRSASNIQTLFSNFTAGSCDMYWAVGLYSRWTGTKDSVRSYIDNLSILDTANVGWMDPVTSPTVRLNYSAPYSDRGPASSGTQKPLAISRQGGRIRVSSELLDPGVKTISTLSGKIIAKKPATGNPRP